MPVDHAAAYANRTALARLVRQAREAGVAPNDIHAWVENTLADAERMIAGGGQVSFHGGSAAIEAARRQMKRVGREIGKLTPSAARGHAKSVSLSPSFLKMKSAGASAKKIKAATAAVKARRVIRQVRRGKSLTKALRGAKTTAATFRKQPHARAIADTGKRGGRRYVFNHAMKERLTIIDANGAFHEATFLPPDRDVVFAWQDAVAAALSRGDAGLLKPFRRKTVRDESGRRYSLASDLGELKMLYLRWEREPNDWHRYHPFRNVGHATAWRYGRQTRRAA
jgi:hypothetical protein